MPEFRAERKQLVVLLVDDDPGDQELTRRALERKSLNLDLRVVADGEQAMDYLLQREDYAAPGRAPRPELILLDLNMPRMNGREVLFELRKNAEISSIPVVVLTTSRQETDILRSYNLGCNSYIEKPLELDGFVEAVGQLGEYWFNVVTLPSQDVRRIATESPAAS